MKVLILAAGYGTRLYPHTRNYPKPLLKIKKKPIINFLLDKIKELDNITGIIVVTNDRFFKQFKAWKNSLRPKIPIRIINDLTTSPQDRLGAVGDMYFTFRKEGFTGDFLVMGGDNFFKAGLLDFIHFAREKHPFVTVGLFDIENKHQARHYGVVSLDKNKRIIKFCEKPSRPKSSLVAMCLYYFPRTKLKLIEEYLRDPFNSRDTTGSYIDWLSKRDKVYGFVFKNLWFDIGQRNIYKRVNRILNKRG